MKDISLWVLDNKEWIFSGAGLAAISIVVRVFYKGRSATVQQHISSGANSTNLSAGGDINLGNSPKKNGVE